MARISKINPRYRTKKQICADAAMILEASLCFGTKFAVLSEITWVWSEFDGKISGCRYWSQKALDEWVVGKNAKILIHEHMVPKKVLIDHLMCIKVPSPEAVGEVLENLCIGAVITKNEDQRLNELKLRSKMPDGWDTSMSPRARYDAAGITLLFREGAEYTTGAG